MTFVEIEIRMDVDATKEDLANLSVDRAEGAGEDEDFVDPWNVVSKSATGVDYDKLISE